MTGFPLANRIALSIEHAALAIGISERALRGCLREIPHTHLDGGVVIPTACLEKWLIERSEADLAVGRFHEHEPCSCKKRKTR